MDEVIREAIRRTEATKKPREAMPWQLDQPHPQACHWFDHGQWQPTPPAQEHRDAAISRLSVWSWNIDFMLPFPRERFAKGIRNLQGLIAEDRKGRDGEGLAHVIFLAECLETDIEFLRDDAWVRSHFALTDLDLSNMASGYYGTTMLVDRRLPIAQCSRVHYSQTRMERDGLFVDVQMGSRLVRLCNTHAESLALQPAYRPPQLKLCAQYMHDPAVHGSILAGDLNAIEDFDRTLHIENNLKDAYLEAGGDANSGHTWGQQAAIVQRECFGLSRMDKALYCGNLRLLHFQTCGEDVELDDETQRQTIRDLGFDKAWITDHLAIRAVFELSAHPRM